MSEKNNNNCLSLQD